MKLTAAKAAGLSTSVVIVGIAALWFAYVRAPGPVEVCTHIAEVTRRESEAAGIAPDTQATLADALHQRCLQHKYDKIQLRGRIAWARYAKCVVAADDLRAIGRC